MHMQLEDIRRDYKHAELNEENSSKTPIQQFRTWMDNALEANITDATAMSLVSVGDDGFPQSRIVLLKDYDENGFTFFTNYNSQKGKAIEKDAKVSLHFYWSEMERQIRISGIASKTNTEVSKKYFHSRPQQSQIAAAISEQSSVVPSRKFLENAFTKLSKQLEGENPDCPSSWGGYKVTPVKFEFWQGRENRLHDRIVYEKIGNRWTIKRLAP